MKTEKLGERTQGPISLRAKRTWWWWWNRKWDNCPFWACLRGNTDSGEEIGVYYEADKGQSQNIFFNPKKKLKSEKNIANFNKFIGSTNTFFKSESSLKIQESSSNLEKYFGNPEKHFVAWYLRQQSASSGVFPLFAIPKWRMNARNNI